MGKVLYQPKGKAGEYAAWAANLYVGCSNMCDYCYCKKGVLGHGMGMPKPQLKAGFDTMDDAVCCFKDELIGKLDKVRETGGVFFSFSTDPCLPETWMATLDCAKFCRGLGVPVTILTKCVDWAYTVEAGKLMHMNPRICVGFTLTGMDEREVNAPANIDRINAMKHIKQNWNVKTFASVEPVIDLERALDMITRSAEWCDLFRIGLVTGEKRQYTKEQVIEFAKRAYEIAATNNVKVYFKESVLKMIDAVRFTGDFVVSSRYNIFNGVDIVKV